MYVEIITDYYTPADTLVGDILFCAIWLTIYFATSILLHTQEEERCWDMGVLSIVYLCYMTWDLLQI